MQLARVEKLSSLPIPYEGIFLVGIPQSLDDLHMLCSSAVSGVVVEMLVATVVSCGPCVATGDHVPPCPPFADQVERRESARDIVR